MAPTATSPHETKVDTEQAAEDVPLFLPEEHQSTRRSALPGCACDDAEFPVSTEAPPRHPPADANVSSFPAGSLARWLRVSLDDLPVVVTSAAMEHSQLSERAQVPELETPALPPEFLSKGRVLSQPPERSLHTAVRDPETMRGLANFAASLMPPADQAIAEKADPLGEVLDWLGRADLGVNTQHAQIGDDFGFTQFNRDGRELQRGATIDFLHDVDEEGLAALAQAPKAWPLKRPHSVEVTPCPGAAGICKDVGNGRIKAAKELHGKAEDEEWLYRQSRTGTVGRLVIYTPNDNPKEDILMRGGFGRPLVVAAVHDAGPAAKAGVKAGDRLVSINGKKDFCGGSSDAVREMLIPPLMLVFTGFVGKLHAEVRLTCAHRLCGLSLRQGVLQDVAIPIQICEETVFDPGFASMFLVVDHPLDSPKLLEQVPELQQEDEIDMCFELQRYEATDLVRKALFKASPPRSSSAAVPRALSGVVRQQLQTNAHIHDWRMPQKPGGDAGGTDDGTEGQVLDCSQMQVAAEGGEELSASMVWPEAPPVTPMLSPRNEMHMGRSVANSPRRLAGSRELGRMPELSEKARKALPCLDRADLCVEYCKV